MTVNFISRSPRLLRPLLILSLVMLVCSIGMAIPIAYRFQIGYTYRYRMSVSTQTNSGATDLRRAMTATASTEVHITPLRFRDGVYILDIRSTDFHGRRYLRPDGTMIAAPGEAHDQLPFFLVFPSGGWRVGATHRLSQPIILGNQSYQASWEITLKELNKEETRATLVFSGAIRYSEDRSIRRTLATSGTLIMDLSLGVPTEGHWTMQYRLLYAAKEQSVTRTLWNMQETTTTRFVLEEAKKP